MILLASTCICEWKEKSKEEEKGIYSALNQPKSQTSPPLLIMSAYLQENISSDFNNFP